MTLLWTGPVTADYNQYLVGDPSAPFDPAAAGLEHDGVLAPQDSCVVVGCGASHGPVQLEVRADREVPSPAGVAAACDLWIPGGVITVMTWENEPVYRYGSGGPLRIRLVVEVFGRDRRNVEGGPAEQHTLTIVPVEAAQPRWRSTETDDMGRFLKV